ncbi:hypothetical protein RRU94_15910 [Domibacillus sp. DTU_2020_1001157_1_SI_ALB_TIR_016]|uniref:hypothetical protein n=1 Tax=Domibacillus sp. DTU_2020_1001157_1_SI_ALB_TIR_016 TaxID=3077789 RepID=UPI0028EE27F7|nr:hypothetical protein [Domibacillus sp. DTU_2020_1001157_1_SI_ALB_TIR_016]WNS82223.1 hypothetical protein RRU94_15910 [Domibacillus sp. DTU_2020_1001157_1_SI_ALB_TIR_016]
MVKYNKKSLIKLLDPATITALNNTYKPSLGNLAARLNRAPQNVFYYLENDSFKGYQKEIILDLLLDHCLEGTELILINSIVNRKAGT